MAKISKATKKEKRREIDALVSKNRKLTYLLDNPHTYSDKSQEWYAEREENKRKIETLKSQIDWDNKKKRKGAKLM